MEWTISDEELLQMYEHSIRIDLPIEFISLLEQELGRRHLIPQTHVS